MKNTADAEGVKYASSHFRQGRGLYDKIVRLEIEMTGKEFIWKQEVEVICSERWLSYFKWQHETGDIEIKSIEEIRDWQRVVYIDKKGDYHHTEKEVNEI